jgi:hypothetical protein
MKKKILFLAANPTRTSRLALDEECCQITAKIREAAHRDSLELISCWAVRPKDLLQHFHQHKPHVVHFSGHGTREGEIILKGKNGKSRAVSALSLKHLFTALKDNIRVVVLNACFSTIQAEAITKVVDCAIGMNNSIRDDVAVVFAAAFYQAIGFGRSVGVAFDCGIAAIRLENVPGKRIPKLLVGNGVDPSRVFVIKEDTKSPRPADPSPTPRRKRSLPRLMAKFREVDGDLCRVTEDRLPEYGMDLWIEGVPPETKTVAYEILDEGFRETTWSQSRKRSSKSVREFLTDDMSSYGDVEIWIRGFGKGVGGWVAQSTLYDALNRYYLNRPKTTAIRRALKQIRTS